MYKRITANKRNTIIIMAIFVLIITAIGAAFAYLNNSWEIAVAFLAVSTIYALVQYFVAGRLAVSMTGGKKIEKKDHPRLYNIVENLSISTGLPMPEVYIIEDPAPNAFATGRDPKHAIVAATTGLLDIMNDKELTAVMAHEMAHVRNYDIRVNMIVFGLVCLIGLISDIGTRMVLYNNRRDSDSKSPVGMLIALIALILAPLAAAITKAAVSRQREYLADSSSAMITRYPEGMVSALKKLEAHARPMKQQNPSTEALFIANPLRKNFINNIFSTHPPIEKRIKRLEDGKKEF